MLGFMGMNTMQALKLETKIKQIKSKLPFEANCYLVFKGEDAIVIDPCIAYHEIDEILKKNNLKLRAVFVTHGHIDHFYYISEYLNFVEKLYYHPKAIEKMSDLKKSYAILTPIKATFNEHSKTVFIKDGQEIKLGSITVNVIYTPGHSNCSVCFLIDDALFTGDTLFYHSVGRTDLYTGNTELLNNSLQKLKNNYPNVTIYPGHEEISTMEEEIINNPYLSEIIN